jgi:hypothetical protein
MDEPPYTCETSEIMNKLDMGEIPETPAKEQGYGPLDAASCSAWVTPKQATPEEGEWVLHTYAGVRPPEYGMYARGRFWRNDGPESFPTTHWLRIPPID